MMLRVPPTTIVADRAAPPVFEQIRPAQIMLRGSSQPLNVQTATANFMAKIVLKPKKERKEERQQKHLWKLEKMFEMFRRISFWSHQTGWVLPCHLH